MKKNLEIKGHEDKTSKSGKDYTRFDTSEGWMSCWDKELAKDIKESEGQTLECEVTEKDNYKNITDCYGLGDKNAESEAEKIEVVDDKYSAMYVSYAKDIFCAMYNIDTKENAVGLMNTAIDLVKKARKEFQ